MSGHQWPSKAIGATAYTRRPQKAIVHSISPLGRSVTLFKPACRFQLMFTQPRAPSFGPVPARRRQPAVLPRAIQNRAARAGDKLRPRE